MLSVTVGSLEFATPLLLASGYITESPEFFLRAREFGCAGMVTRSLKQHVPPERQHIPVPRYAIHQQRSMLNCEWGNERPWTSWRDGGVQAVQKTGSPIIMSLSGRDPEGCAALIREFDELNVDAFEINISCSHSGALHGNLNVDQLQLEQLMRTVRKVTTTPIWIKVSYSTQLVGMALTAERFGADAIVCTNSIGPGMLIDTRTGYPQIGIEGGGGGLTGEAIFPIALWCVHQLAKAVSIPIVGCGGVATADHVLQMLMSGASAVQIYTAPALRGPREFGRIVRGLEGFLARSDYETLRDLVGITIPHTQSHSFSSPRPEVLPEKCTGCTLCVASCAFDAITMVERPGEKALAVIHDNCVSCNACVGACPPRFGAILSSFGGNA